MASAASNLLNLLTLGSGRIKDNEEFGVEVTPDGIRSTGDRYKQSGLGRFISKLGGDKTAGDLNREFENALLQADIDRQIQAMQAQSQAQSQQDLARLTNSLTGQRELDAFTRNRGAEVEDRDLAFERAREAAKLAFERSEQAKDAALDRMPFETMAKNYGLTPEESRNPAVRKMLNDIAMIQMDNIGSQAATDVANRAATNRAGRTPVNLRGVEGALPLSAVLGMGGNALNLAFDPEEQKIINEYRKAQTARQLLMGQPKPMDPYVQALLNGGNQPINVRQKGKSNARLIGDQLIFNERE